MKIASKILFGFVAIYVLIGLYFGVGAYANNGIVTSIFLVIAWPILFFVPTLR